MKTQMRETGEGQFLFAFGGEVAVHGEPRGWRGAVQTLLRFTAGGEFNAKVGYAQWLAWFSPLSPSYVNGGAA
jgi:hypothetical protein